MPFITVLNASSSTREAVDRIMSRFFPSLVIPGAIADRRGVVVDRSSASHAVGATGFDAEANNAGKMRARRTGK